MFSLKKLIPLILTLFILAACTLPAPQTPTTSPDDPITSETPVATEPAPPAGEMITGVALVDNVDLLLLESFPVQVNATVRGNLPDGCTTLDQIIHTRPENPFAGCGRAGTVLTLSGGAKLLFYDAEVTAAGAI